MSAIVPTTALVTVYTETERIRNAIRLNNEIVDLREDTIDNKIDSG
jgi:hypothetical protein